MPFDASASRRLPDRLPEPSLLLFVSNYRSFVVGGAEVVASHLAGWLTGAGHDVTVVSTCGRKDGEMDGVVDRVQVHRFFPHNLWWNYRGGSHA